MVVLVMGVIVVSRPRLSEAFFFTDSNYKSILTVISYFLLYLCLLVRSSLTYLETIQIRGVEDRGWRFLKNKEKRSTITN